MGKLTRIALFVFVIAAVLGVGTLATLWFAWDPLLPFAAGLAAQEWFDIALLVLLGVTAAGLFAALVWALAAPGKGSKLTILRDNSSIAITKDAIRSTAAHVIESYRGLSSKGVQVTIKGRRHPRLLISAKVDPSTNTDLADLGTRVQGDVVKRVSAFAGYPVEDARITFVGPQDPAPVAPAKHVVNAASAA